VTASLDSSGWDRRYSGSELVWSGEPNRLFAEQVAELPPRRALDLGCGEGRNAVWLAECGWQVTGVDFSSVGLEKAARLAEARGVSVEWVLADLREYVPPAGAFDLVAVLYLHVAAADRQAIHARAAEALAPGGLLLVIGHDATNPEHGHGGPRDPAILFTPDELVADVPELEVERAERFRRPVETADGRVHAIDAILRAHRAPA
jgi:SAM-dependent methyltransferase